MKVFKFGGASVKDAQGVRNLASIISANRSEKLLIVVSAMGKMTNALEALTYSYFEKKENTHQLFSEIKNYHFSILDELFPEKEESAYNDLNNTFVEIEWILEEEPTENFNFIYDQIVSHGELASTKIIASYLQKLGLPIKWMDARGLIQTDNTFREAHVNWDVSESLIQKTLKAALEQQIIVTQGFIGGTSENYTTTLGREGSDYSAAVFASCLKAESLTIWKDVPGILNADPKLFDKTFKYDELPYSEAVEMSYYGASVIHPKTIKPLQNQHIPLYVKPFMQPEEKGTAIGLKENIDFDIPAIIIKKNQLLLTISTRDYSFIVEKNFSYIFGMFAYHHIKINMMQNSALSFSVCIDNDLEKTMRLVNDLKENFKVLYNEHLELITIRHYNEQVIADLTRNRELILEQRSRNTIQLIVK